VSTGLEVRVQPKARSAGLVGWMADGTLKLKVSEPAEDGRANRAVEALLAAALGVRVAAVRVIRGRSSRGKTVEVEGLDRAAIAARITAELGRQKKGSNHGD
jgi:uncharacterized protein YggU (UPF0235/DUF167 family)